MGFRGIFLHRCPGTEEGSAAKFTVLCTEAELCLLVERHEASDIDPSGVVDTKVLVKNSSTTDLLFVARMADVTMEVGSMFWVDGTTVYCFRFSSDNSFAEVQRAVHALRRTEQLALMRSVLSFHPLGNTANDGKDKGAKWKHYSECANLDSSQGAEELPVDNNHVVAIPKPSKPRKLVVDKCPNGVLDHIYCGRCLHYKFNENLNDFMDRGLQYSCRLCAGTCDCSVSEALSLPTSVELEVPSWPPVDPQDSLTYFTSYAQAVIHRETRRTPPKLSEDSCFCCKDGGDLIECDFKAKIKCPKKHLPASSVLLFPTPPDTHPSTSYVLCESCDVQIVQAVHRRLLPPMLHATPVKTHV
ncbi:hypothetical protein B5M09_007217 [Aphanomyces astaci]|uniref:Zinc-finger domain-containing protein n=1 Tax=Aphanomyces astaci TaxID=112090 RepID=A0A425DG51_APHAT|nr:hypothetical protein B5M09_007217 [Aphanomyces astaci]